MILDLSDLLEVGSSLNYLKELKVDHLDFRGKEIPIKDSIKIDLDVLKTDNSFVLTGELKVSLILQCSRCLKEYAHPIEVEISDELLIEDIEDLKNVNVFPILVSGIILEIPIKPLHDESCKGLCSICGQNLNEGECDCEEEIVDPRLAKLKEFKEK
ncbi:MAG: YceD family protein [Bacillota bacterium]